MKIKEIKKNGKLLEMSTWADTGFFIRLSQSGWTKTDRVINLGSPEANWTEAKNFFNKLKENYL